MASGKSPGPDELPTGFCKELSSRNRKIRLQLINDWWESDNIPEEALLARVVLIYKKGALFYVTDIGQYPF